MQEIKISISMSHIRLFTLCFGLLIIAVSSDARLSCPGNRDTALFVLGDSLFDPGTNNFINTTKDFQANFVPYGESFFRHPTGRFSDGRLIPDFIAEFARLPFAPPYLQPGIETFRFIGGANFASGGAGALTETHEGFVVDLKTQMRQFEKLEKRLKKKFGDLEVGKTVSEAVYMISIGGNDYLAPSTLFQSYPNKEYVAMVIGNLTTVIKRIHSKGGRKFGLVNLVPIGCLPQQRALAGRSGACFDELSKLPKLHNRALPKALKKLQEELDGFKFSIFDIFDVVMEKINNPSKYGYKEVKIACCGSGTYRGNYSCGGMRGEPEYELCKDPSEYFFFDAFHPTESAYRQLAESMWSGRPPVTGPYNLEALFDLE